MKFFLSFLLYIIISLNAFAQFYTVGDDPASIKWYKTETENFSIIYPEGLDSLAKTYGYNLEKYRIPVGRSAGYTPGEYINTKMPVVLHAWNAQANGSVAWAPKRMDLFTLPQAYGPEALPWVKTLAIHESRHAAQMQFGLSYVFKPLKYIFGEMLNGAAAGIYPGKWLLEGDAVVAETALSNSGRGRSADFLNYYMAAFDNGDFRNFYRWNYGSYKYFTPDKYALGYMMISGIRYRFDTPHFSDIYLQHAAKQPYDVLVYRSASKRISGQYFLKNFEDALKVHHSIWKEEKEARKPFIKTSEATDAANNKYTVYTGNIILGNSLWAIKNSIDKSSILVMIDSLGHERAITSFAGQCSKLEAAHSARKIFWSEIKAGIRWNQKNTSVIKYYDIDSGRKKTLTHGTRYYHPSANSDGTKLAVTEYLVRGGSRIVIIDSSTGKEIDTINAPAGMQAVESVWSKDRIFISAIEDNGFGIYSIHLLDENRNWECHLEPQPVQIKDLRKYRNDIYFTCDRSGVNELYCMKHEDNTLYRMTSTEYGSDNFQFGKDGGELFFSAAGHNGKLPVKTCTSELNPKRVSDSDIHRYKIADKLSEQERILALSDSSVNTTEKKDENTNIKFSEPERYRKFPNLFNIHSWAPVYFNYDNITNFSYDYIYELASLGATALIQNRLGTFTGYLGYSAHKDPYNKSFWRHSGHIKFTYTGLFPVIEASFDINDRAGINSRIYGILNGNTANLYMDKIICSRPYLKGKISVYIPLNLSGGGWNRGIVPQLSWNITNDIIDYSIPIYTATVDGNNMQELQFVKDFGKSEKKLMQSVNASVRLYSVRSMTSSEIYPDFGGGIEAGISQYCGNTIYLSPMTYVYAYGYLPGITREQGLNLSVTWQHSLKQSFLANSVVNTLPRGLVSSLTLKSHIASYRHSAKISANYAIPVYIGDFHISSIFYGKRAVITPHFDYTFFGKNGNLFSAGVSACVEFGCFLWIATPISIGVTYSYNGGKSFSSLNHTGFGLGHHFVGPIFKIALPQ